MPVPCLAAADIMVTDHSSVGFEYLVLDRPLLVFDTPGLVEAARINPEKVALLRSAATVVHSVEELVAAAAAECVSPQHRSVERRRVAREMFHDPGRATDRARRPHPRGPRHPGTPRRSGRASRYNNRLGEVFPDGRDRPHRDLQSGGASRRDPRPLWRGCACPRPSAGKRSSSTTIRPTTPGQSSSATSPGSPSGSATCSNAAQGRSSALNAGIAGAEGAVLAFTDDDVQVVEGWLDAAVGAFVGNDQSIAYSGGPVRP